MSQLYKYIDELIPSEGENGAPSFTEAVSLNDFKKSINDLEKYETYFENFKNSECKSGGINFLKYLIEFDRDLVKEIEDKMLTGYFTSPVTLSRIGSTKFPLFPNNRALPEIDFDLLEPVLMKDYENE